MFNIIILYMYIYIYIFFFLFLQIDWGIETVTTTDTGADNIDWGEGGEEDTGGIDWGDSGETIDWGETGQDNQDSAIDWGDDTGTADHEVTVDSGGITLEGSGQGQ